MLGLVRQEWRRVATRSEQGKICASLYAGDAALIGVEDSNGTNRPVYISDSPNKGLAKAQLHQLCAREHWKQPVYECFKDEGPPHHKQFTFKVVLNIEGASATTLESFGNPQTNKKAAADDAAGGALWCLKQMGYQL